jgi:hypothetical protein
MHLCSSDAEAANHGAWGDHAAVLLDTGTVARLPEAQAKAAGGE